MDENLNLMPQKLLTPFILEKMMIRPRLLEHIRESETSILMIVAPAGFGKTVLLSQLTEVFNQPAVWYQLDEYDNDPAVFWRYLIAGCEKHSPAFGKEILSFINTNQSGLNGSRTVLSMLIREFEKNQKGLTLVFDDLHVLTKPEVKLFIKEFLRHLPSRVKVLMAGRSEVLGITRLLAEGKIQKLDGDHLYFSREDIAGYYLKNGIGLTGTELDTIEKTTEGWPLAVNALLKSHGWKKAGITNLDREILFDYMASEILQGEEEYTRRFLTAISVLDDITPEYCDMLLERKDSRKILSSLQRKHFFLTPLIGKNDTYRYHQLFRDFLIQRLGDERYGLLEKAGDAAIAMGEIERAVESFLAAGNLVKARRTMKAAGQKLIGRGNWQTVERWLNSFSDEEIACDPWFALYKAQIDVNRGRIYSGENWINHAIKAFSDVDEREGLAESRLLKAKILRYQGQYQDSLSLLQLAIPDLVQEETKGRFDSCMEESYTLMLCGRFAEAEEILNRALKVAEQNGDTVLMTYFYEGLGTVSFAWGYFDRSMHYYRRGIAISPDKSLRNYYFQDSIGPIYLDWGELEQAYVYLEQSVTAKENFGLTESLPSAYFQLGNVLLDRGELLRAEQYFSKALRIIEEHGGDHFVHTLTTLLLSVCLGAQGRLAEAQDLADKARSQAGVQSNYLNGLFQVVGCIFMLQTGNLDAAHLTLNEILPMLEMVGARKPLCIAYSALALIGILRENEKDASLFGEKALTLASEMNFTHDFLLSFEIYQPLLYLGIEKDIEVSFIQRILVRLGVKALPLLRNLMEHPDSFVRERAVGPLTQIEGSAISPLNHTGGTADSFAAEKDGIRLELMGPVRIFSGDREITNINWVRSKSRDLFVYLAHLRNPVGKDRIIEAIWPDTPYEQANTLFHTVMHTLRHILKEHTGKKDLILYRGGRYCLLPGNVNIDKQSFQEILAAVGNDDVLTERAVSLLEEAVGMYRGLYLEEMEYTWVIPEQEYIKQLYNKTRDRLSGHYLDKKNYLQAIHHLEHLVRDNPLTEEYCRRLILAYGGIGDLKSIHLQYYRLRSALKDELGLSPSKEIQSQFSRMISSH